MPIELGFTPQEATCTHERPKRTTVSDFTGFAQQVSTQAPIWSGEISHRQVLEAGDVRAWRSFINRTAAGDGTFWAPIWAKGNHEAAVPAAWLPASATDRTELEIVGHDYEVGDLVQVRALRNRNVSFVKVVVAVSGDAVSVGSNLPFFNLLHGGLETTNKGIKVRAIIENADAETITMAPGLIGSPATIAWREAMGHLLHELDGVVLEPEAILTEGGFTLTTESGDTITTEHAADA